jgi:hypothetical protein
MNRCKIVGASLAAALLCSCALAQDGLKSGPPPGHALAPFHPLNITNPENPNACGQKNCLV